MKVIAKIDATKMLCEIDVTELALLHGFRSSYDTGFNKDVATNVGAECNIKKMVTTSQFVRSIRPETLTKTKANLEQLLKQVDDTMLTVAGLEVFNILSEEQQIGD